MDSASQEVYTGAVEHFLTYILVWWFPYAGLFFLSRYVRPELTGLCQIWKVNLSALPCNCNHTCVL
jgi:hypothetical protein